MNMVNTTPFEGTISLREHHSTSDKTSFEAISSFQEIRHHHQQKERAFVLEACGRKTQHISTQLKYTQFAG